jgi:hypothetical protein
VIIEGIRDLIIGERPETSLVGIILTGASIIIVSWLAHAKRKAGRPRHELPARHRRRRRNETLRLAIRLHLRRPTRLRPCSAGPIT